MKKLLAAVILIATVLTFASCGGNSGNVDSGTNGDIGDESVKGTENANDTVADSETSLIDDLTDDSDTGGDSGGILDGGNDRGDIGGDGNNDNNGIIGNGDGGGPIDNTMLG